MTMRSDCAVVLHSGGQDSTTCLFWARERFSEVHSVSIDYGQRHRVELEAAAKIGKMARVASHTVLALPALAQLSDSDLVRSNTEIQASGGRPDQAMPEGLPSSFVPGRNILFLSLAAALAAKVGARYVATGVCQTDYSGYPDCREEFVLAMNKAINLGFPSSCEVELLTPLMFLTKRQTVELAMSLDGCMDALAHSVTCYNGQVPGCGECPACLLRAKGFEEAGVHDPQFV